MEMQNKVGAEKMDCQKHYALPYQLNYVHAKHKELPLCTEYVDDVSLHIISHIECHRYSDFLV